MNSRAILGVFAVAFIITPSWSQVPPPSSPSKEYIRLGSRVIAVEAAGTSQPVTYVTTSSSPGQTPNTAMTLNFYDSNGAGNVEYASALINYLAPLGLDTCDILITMGYFRYILR